MRTAPCAAIALLVVLSGNAVSQAQQSTAHDHSHHGSEAQVIAEAAPMVVVQPNANATIVWINSPPASISTVTINVLETVTWNGNFSSHPLNATDSAFSTNTQLMANSGTTFTLGFVLPGTYYFRCGNHPMNMRTTVIVSGAGGPPNQQGKASRKVHVGAGSLDLPLLP